MAPQEEPETLWVVVKVERGIPVLVEAYRDEQSAEMREQVLCKYIHPDEDETGVFEVQVGYADPDEPPVSRRIHG